MKIVQTASALVPLTQSYGGNRVRGGRVVCLGATRCVCVCVPSDADLGRQDVEVARAVGLADELARVLGRHPRVLGHPHHGGRAPVGVEAEAVERRALLVAIALTYSTQQQDGGGGGGERGGGERQGKRKRWWSCFGGVITDSVL